MLLRLFLLVMLIRHSSSTNPPSIIVENCDKMGCFAPQHCIIPEAESTEMARVFSVLKVTENCEAIVKIRSYSLKHYLIVMESYFERIKWIKLEQGNTVFECKNEAGKISATYNNVNKELIRKAAAKLLCEFVVKNETSVFETLTDTVKLSTRLTEVTSGGGAFHDYSKPTCDPDSVKPAALGAVGDKTVSAVDVRLADLVCPAGKKLMFRKDSSSEFEEATSISCLKRGTSYEFEPKLVEAQCAITTCTQCNSEMAPPDSNIETYSEEGCIKLRCKNGDRMKIGSAEAVEGSAECKFDNNQHVWQMNGITINAHSTVSCLAKMKCFSTEDDVKKVCKDCILGPDNLPKCAGNTSTLMQGSLKMNIRCDDVTGKYILYVDGEDFSGVTADLHCEDKKAANAEEQKSSNASLSTALYITIPLLVLGALSSVGYLVWRHLQKRKNAIENEKKAAEEGQVKPDQETKSAKSATSLESGKVNSAEEASKKPANEEESKKSEAPKVEEAPRKSQPPKEEDAPRKSQPPKDDEAKKTTDPAKKQPMEGYIPIEEHVKLVSEAMIKGYRRGQAPPRERRPEEYYAGPGPEGVPRPIGGRPKRRKQQQQQQQPETK